MDKKNVNIYITTTSGPKQRRGVYMYLLEARKANGENATRQQMMTLEDTTENQLAVCALEAALSRLTAPVSLTIWTDCGYLYGTLENRQFERWRQQDWKNEKGDPIKYVDKWLRIEYLLNAHDFQMKYREHHEYKDWMSREMKKEIERRV